jgi:signal transduction histidine kinase
MPYQKNSCSHKKNLSLFILLLNIFIFLINNTDKSFELKVRDDGKGFLLDNILESQKASGLRNILKRAKLSGMDCKIDSSSVMDVRFI